MVNKKHLLGILVMVLVFGITVAGCATTKTEHLGQFTFASTMNVDLSRLGEFNRTAQLARGESRQYQNFFGNWKGDTDRRYERAMDNAIRSVPGGVAIIDVRMEQTTKYSLIRNRPDERVVVTGTVLVDPRIVTLGASDETLLSVQTAEGETITLVPLTDKDLQVILADNIHWLSAIQ